MSRGAPKVPITYEGPYEPGRTYLPRQVVKQGSTAYLCVATSTGVTPGSDASVWIPLGGDGEHNSVGVNSTAVGTSSTAGDDGVAVGDLSQAGYEGTAVGYYANASADASTAVGATASAGLFATALGQQSAANGIRSLAIGSQAICNDDDRGVIRINDLELIPSAGPSSTLVLRSPNGSRWRLSVSNAGVLSVAAA